MTYKEIIEKYNLFDTNGELIVPNLISLLSQEKLGNNITYNDNGDMTIGRHLEVDGNLQVNGNLKDGLGNTKSITDIILKTLPNNPTNDGTYTLKCVKSGDTITYQWVLDE